MTGLALSLLRLGTRLAVALVLALLLALLLVLVRDRGDFRSDLAIACLIVGCLFLLLAPAGHSPAMRGGTIDTWTASFFPQLVPRMSEEYGGRSLSASAVVGLTGIVLIVAGALLAG